MKFRQIVKSKLDLKNYSAEDLAVLHAAGVNVGAEIAKILAEEILKEYAKEHNAVIEDLDEWLHEAQSSDRSILSTDQES